MRSHEAWLHRKNLEAGRLTVSSHPLVLESISTSEQQQGQLLAHFSGIMNMWLIPIWMCECLVYKTQLPVVLPVCWHYVEIWQWPPPLLEFQGCVLLPDAVLRFLGETRSLDVSPQCFGVRPWVYVDGAWSAIAGILPCVTQLLAEASTYDPNCVIMIEKRLPVDCVFAIEQNQYILVTDWAELALRCAGRTEQSTVVDAGVLEITLAFPCSLHSATWKLVPIRTPYS